MTPKNEIAWSVAHPKMPAEKAIKVKFTSLTAVLTSGYRRELLPDPVSYYESQGLILLGSNRSPWKTTECRFHGGSDSMRIKVSTGAFVCMACGARGGDVLAYEMAVHGVGFVQAAKQMGAWTGGQTQMRHIRPAALTARDALSVLADEVTLIALEGTRIARGVVPTAVDLERMQQAAGRINHVREIFA